jgi:tRNA pseudouridine55 synthase
MAVGNQLHGILVVDKPGGMTSHDVVAQARRLYGVRAVGHAGTLDPMATGVLVLLFGEACKLSPYLTGQSKRYRAMVEFGRSTDSLDRDGKLTEERELEPGWLDDGRLADALEREWRRTLQLPPQVSAISLGGQRAHALARAGKVVELSERPVAVEHLVVVSREERRLELELGVSKGYYVRALARDLGASLGVPAHLAELRRTASGSFSIDEATPWPVTTPPPLLGMADSARRALPVTRLSPEGARKARLGQLLAPDDASCPAAADEASCWLSPSGDVVAIGCRTEHGFRVLRGFSAA